jgi:hypothetical protein
VAVKRGFFRRIVQTFMDTTRFIFFDETAANTKMTRLYGRAPIGERLVASVPHGHWKTTTFVAGLGLDGIVPPPSSTSRWTGRHSSPTSNKPSRHVCGPATSS